MALADCCRVFAKVGLVGVNVIFMLLGMALIGGGIFGVVKFHDYRDLIGSTAYLYAGAPVLRRFRRACCCRWPCSAACRQVLFGCYLPARCRPAPLPATLVLMLNRPCACLHMSCAGIGLGAFTLVVALIGLIGAATHSRCLLIAYVSIVFILLLGEIANCVLVIVLTQTVNAASSGHLQEAKAGAERSIQHFLNCSYNRCCNFTYASNSTAPQPAAECDDGPMGLQVPKAVCSVLPSTSQQCVPDQGVAFREAAGKWIQGNLVVIVAIAASTAGVQLVTLILAFILVCKREGDDGSADAVSAEPGSAEEKQSLTGSSVAYGELPAQ